MHAPPIANAVPGFAPSMNGLRFANRFPAGPAITIRVAGRRLIRLGDAADGLCGGMCAVVRRRFEAGRPPWSDRDPPAEGSRHFRELVHQQVRTFEYGRLPLRFYSRMAWRPTETNRLMDLVGLRPLGEDMAHREWPRIRADIDRGRLASVGLVRVRSADPRLLGRHHQVLGYGYRIEDDVVALRIYDPNHPDDDSVELRFTTAKDRPVEPVQSTGEPLVGFFHASRPARVAPSGVVADRSAAL